MISRKQWAVLLFIYILYLLLGATVFMYTERGHEINSLKDLHREQRHLTLKTSLIEDENLKFDIRDSISRLEDMLGDSILLPNRFLNLVQRQMGTLKYETNVTTPTFYSNETISDLIIRGRFVEFQNAEVVDESGGVRTLLDTFWEGKMIDETIVEDEAMWTMYNSFFFSFQTITTIGFGQMSPKTNIGKSFCLAYSILGVAFNGIVFASLADLFSHKFIKKIDNKRYEVKLMIVLDAILYLIPGILIFFVCPAAVFMIVEGWSYLSSFYYTFVTLSTIGFGDMVSGYVDLQPAWLWAYRIFIHAWIIFGLGYLLMIITFIQSALRSKQLRTLDKKMAKLLKQKASRRRVNLHKDLDKLRLLLKAIVVQQQQNRDDGDDDIFNIEEESGDSDDEKGDVGERAGKENLAFEDDSGLVMNVPKPPSKPKERKMSREVDSIEIFLKLAASVLKEHEKRELIARVSKTTDGLPTAAPDKSSSSAAAPPHHPIHKTNKSANNLAHNNHNSSNNLSGGGDGRTKGPKEEDTQPSKENPEAPSQEPVRKMSLKRKLSAWRVNYLASTSNDTDSVTESSPDDDEDEDNDNDVTDFGDLIDKVEKMISQEVKVSADSRPPFARKRSYSLGTIVSTLD